MPTTFRDFRLSRAPEALGRCVSDIPYLLDKVNEATLRLIQSGKNQGFWGSTAQMVFSVSNNYITTPRFVSQVTDLAVCQQSIPMRNPYYEFLSWGNGLQPSNVCQGACNGSSNMEAIDRGGVPTQRAIDATNQSVRVYPTDPRDAGRRILIQGLDSSGLTFRCQDGFAWTIGQYITLAFPFANLKTDLGVVFGISSITGIQKDMTYGDLPLYQYDLTTGVEVLLSRYDSYETNPQYRRYYLNNLPGQCCSSSCANVTQVTGMVKLDYYPVQLDSDWLLIQNIPALISECQSIRYFDMETPQSLIMAKEKHKEAIRLLNQELDHRTDRNHPAIGVGLMDKVSFERNSIGTLV